MPTLQVRELPEDIYRRLRMLAESENRSLAQETIVLLRKALEIETTQQERRKAVLDSLARLETPKLTGMFSPEEMVREDRDR